MNSIVKAAIFLVTVAIVSHANADVVREDELEISSDVVQNTEVDQAIDLRNIWPVATLGEIGLKYSAVGWDFTEKAAGATVRLNLLEGAFVGGSFVAGTDSRNLATGLTGKGTYTWLPSGVEKKVYRILHETTRGGTADDGETFCAYFDFADCEMVTETEFRGAVLGVTQPVTPVDDLHHPWSRIGGDGEGLRNDADGATLSFTFTGTGTFSAELLFTAGSVLVKLDGETVATITSNAAWTEYSWPVADYDAHTLTLTYGGNAGVRVRGCAFVGDALSDVDLNETSFKCDLRPSPRQLLKREWVLPFEYSATNWTGLTTAAADPKSAVSIVRLKGSDSDPLTSWTEEPNKRRDLLKPTAGEGETRWSTAAGVWKATHYLIDGETTNATESAIFDVRETLNGTRVTVE